MKQDKEIQVETEDLEAEQEEKEKEKRRKFIIILILLLLLLLMIIFMVTYSLFSYTKKGDTDNTVTTGKIKFLYTENTGVGNGINITNAFPVEDSVGKSYATDKYVFDFKVSAELPDNTTVPYEVTARMNRNSSLPANVVKTYLVLQNGNTETPSSYTVDNNGVVKRYSELPDTSLQVGNYEDGSKIVEKTIYQATAAGKNYNQDFRLRMWIASDTDFSEVVQPDGSVIYPYNDKNFTINVNVYSIDK